VTIVFQGHVERIETGHNNKLDVHVVTSQAECGQTIVLHVQRKDAAHWLPGRMVSVTAYAFDPPEPEAAKGDKP
jgi:hypothetical protein